MRTRGAFLVCCAALAACGEAGQLQRTTPATQAAPTAGGDLPSDPRALHDSATFAELVAAARSLDAKPTAAAPAGCLLRARAGAFRLEADVLAGARPLPPPPDALAKHLDLEAQPVNVLSAWGGLDASPTSTLSVVAFTTTTPRAARASAFVAFITQRGVYLRGDDPALREQPGALSHAAFGALLARAAIGREPTLYVTAEAAINVEALRAVLLAIPARYEVGLAVALPPGTQIPAAPNANPEGLCPDGLPAPADDEPEGDLDAAALTTALTPLREAALQCAMQAGGRALLGGRLVLALRIAATGRASELCLVEDAIGELVLRRCLIESARQIAFPVPQPSGSVDVQLPLELSLSGPSAQRPLCD
jgi:hypothetical protein